MNNISFDTLLYTLPSFSSVIFVVVVVVVMAYSRIGNENARTNTQAGNHNGASGV